MVCVQLGRALAEVLMYLTGRDMTWFSIVPSFVCPVSYELLQRTPFLTRIANIVFILFFRQRVVGTRLPSSASLVIRLIRAFAGGVC